MRVRNQTSDSSQESERFNFEVGRRRNDVWFIEGDIRVILLVDVEVFYQTAVEEIVKGYCTIF